MSDTDRRERDVRILRRASVLLARAAEACADAEEATVTRRLMAQVWDLAQRLEAQEC